MWEATPQKPAEGAVLISHREADALISPSSLIRARKYYNLAGSSEQTQSIICNLQTFLLSAQSPTLLQRSHYGAPAERFRAADERSQVPTLHGWSHPYLTGQLLGVPSQY